jgi:hypothetical protein
LFEVARRPSSRPAFARIADPEHTDIVTSAVAARRRKKSSIAGFSSCGIVPKPPGRRMSSSIGALAKSNSATVFGR